MFKRPQRAGALRALTHGLGRPRLTSGTRSATRSISRRPSAFTLVELLVVIGIIAVLIGILLPALTKARESANTVKCAANLRSIGQGMAQYVAEFKQTYPAAYIYYGMTLTETNQTPAKADQGYLHWSAFLYGSKVGIDDNPKIYESPDQWKMFQCPSLDNGGLPPTNTTNANRDPGQVNDDGNVVDLQAPRIAYTVNEAVCPRNKFRVGFQGAKRVYQFVRASQVKKSSETVLATEWNPDWHIVADTARDDTGGGSQVCKSHRPIHGFIGAGGNTGELNMEKLAPIDPFRPTTAAGYRKCGLNDVSPDPALSAVGGTYSANSRLDWVGRNHGRKKNGAGQMDDRKTNFLYCDGHVETKHITDTVVPFQWGDLMYSLRPNGDIAP